MKRRRHIAIILLVAITWTVFPKLMIHELFHHGETCDNPEVNTTEPNLGLPHNHCQIFQWQGIIFDSFLPGHTIIPSTLDFFYFELQSTIEVVLYSGSSFQRGPPFLA